MWALSHDATQQHTNRSQSGGRTPSAFIHTETETNIPAAWMEDVVHTVQQKTRWCHAEQQAAGPTGRRQRSGFFLKPRNKITSNNSSTYIKLKDILSQFFVLCFLISDQLLLDMTTSIKTFSKQFKYYFYNIIFIFVSHIFEQIFSRFTPNTTLS